MKTFKKELSLLLVAALVISSIIIGVGTVTVHAYDQAVGQLASYRFEVATGYGSNCGDGGTANNCVITITYTDTTTWSYTIPGESNPNYFEQHNTDNIFFSGVPAKPISSINMNSSGGDSWRMDWANFYYSPDTGSTWLKIGTLGGFEGSNQYRSFTYPSDYSLNSTSLNKTLTFNANGGTGGKQIYSEYGATLPASNIPPVTRTGYTFTGWSPAVPTTGPAADTTYTAQWMEINPAITFNSNGGSAVETITPGYGNSISKPTDPVKEGFNFGGWFLNSELNLPVYWPFTVMQSTVFYARWNAENYYTVTFNASGGLGGSSDAMPARDPLTAPAVTKTGYIFTSWSPEVPVTVPAENSVYTALWTANTYTVSYNGNGNDAGNTANSLHTYDIASALTANGFTKVGYSLSGWSTNQSATTAAYTNGQSVLNLTPNLGEVITFYAVWSANYYIITFNANGGAGGTSASKQYGTALTAPTVTKTGYTFAYWSPAVPATVPAANSTYTAQWTANQYLVTFDPQGGSVSPTSSTVTYGSTYGTGTGGFPTPIKTGYTFGGWYTGTNGSGSNRLSTTTVTTTAAHTLYAKWTGVSYTVAYNGNGSTGGSMGVLTHTYGTAANLLPNRFTNTGYAFEGWATSPDGVVIYTDGQSVINLTETSGATVTLYAKWTNVNVATITFDSNGGAGGTSTTLLIGAPLTAPTVARNGYTFTGWSPAVPSTVPEEDTTYTAQWSAETFTVTFNPQSGTVTPTTSTVTYDSTYGAGTGGWPTPTRAGYTFGGWYTSAGGAGANIISSTVVTIIASQTLHAYWIANQYTITFDANSGTGGTSNTMSCGAALTAPAVTREGYTLIGWSPAVPATVPAADTTYTAQWGISVTITFDANGGNGGTSTVKGAGAALTAPTVTRTGYTFANWSPAVPTTVPAVNTTYTAQWTAKTFTVTFNPQSGTVSPTTSTVTYDSTYGAGTGGWPTPTRAGYTFGGWFTSSSGGGTQIFSTTIAARTSSQTLYAYWSANSIDQAAEQTAYYGFTVKTSGQSIGDGTGTANNLNVTINYSDGTSATSNTIPGESSPNYFEAGNTDIIVLSPQLPAKPISSISFNTIGFDRWQTSYAYIVYSYDGGTNWVQIASMGGIDGRNSTYYFTYPSTYSLNTGATNSLNKILTFNANGGAGGKQIYSEYGATLPASNIPTVSKPGYNLAGWSPAVPATGPSADTTYTAQWTTSNINITFDANGGTGGTSNYMTFGAALTAPTVTRTGYTFSGWSPAVPQVVPEVSTTYTAQWTANTYTVSFLPQGGTVSPTTSTVTYDSTYGEGTGGFPTPTRTGYTFGGWYTGLDGTGTNMLSTTTVTKTNNHSLNANWIANTYTVTFNPQGGSVSPATKSVTYCSTYGILPTPTRAGYTFSGWYTSICGTGTNLLSTTKVTITGTLTLYAKWTGINYTVSYDGNGSSGGSTASSTHIFGVAKALSANGYIKTGYAFLGWATSPDGDVVYSDGQDVSNLTETGGAAVTLYAKWSIINGSVITFNANGSAGGKVFVLVPGEMLTAPPVVKSGYTFTGWAPEVPATVPEVDNTYTAQWTPNTYTITYNGNGSSAGSTANSFHIYDSAADLAANGFTKTNCTFLGWSTDPGATAPMYVDGQNVLNLTASPGGNFTLYAVWLDNNITNLVGFGDYIFSVFNGEAAVIGYTGIGGAISLPGSVYGIPVTSIGSNAFSTKQTITGVIIPTGVSVIGTRAFINCSNLLNVTIPNSVTEIELEAFNSCYKLINASIPSSVTIIGKGAFNQCFELVEVTAYGATTIGAYAFNRCSKLVSLHLSTNLTTIGSYAFEYCEELTAAYFYGNAPTSVGYGAFSSCADGFTIYHLPDKTGFTSPTWYGYPTAVFTPVSIISFDSGGGTTVPDITQDFGTAVTAPANPARAGYTFTGWLPAVPSVMPAENMVCTAQWSQTPVLVPPAESTAVIDNTGQTIYGLAEGLSQADFESSFIGITGNGRLEITPVYEDNIGTGTKIELIDNATNLPVATYYIVIFGDVTGDSLIDSADADAITNYQNYELEWDFEASPWLFAASDLSGDTVVDSFDADIVTNCLNFELGIDQTTGIVHYF